MHFETATIVVTHEVRRAVIGGRTIAFPTGTTNANAPKRVEAYVGASTWTYQIIGPRGDATLVVAVVRPNEAWKEAEKRLEALSAKTLRAQGWQPVAEVADVPLNPRNPYASVDVRLLLEGGEVRDDELVTRAGKIEPRTTSLASVVGWAPRLIAPRAAP